MASSNSPIEWTDASWNPVRGCSRVSEGCRHCYAERVAYRFGGAGKPYEGLVRLGKQGPAWTGVVRLIEDALAEPLSWRVPKKIFVNSMSDLFHESLPDAAIDQVYAVMLLTPWHTHQVVTKRPERAARYLNDPALYSRVLEAATKIRAARRRLKHGPDKAGLDRIAISNPATHPPRWIWLVTSVESQKTADERIPHLLRCPAAVLGVSYEPALEAVDFSRWLRCQGCGLGPNDFGRREQPCCPDRTEVLDWLIAGGESGPGARPCDLAWLRGAVAQARAAGAPVFVKQLGARPTWGDGDAPRKRGLRRIACIKEPGALCNTPAWCVEAGHCKSGALTSSKGGDMTEWPQDLRVREFPQVGVSRG